MKAFPFILLTIFSSSSLADVSVKLFKVDENNQQVAIGQVTAKDSEFGLILQPQLSNLPAGLHGFHVHINPTCADHAMAAGGHLDPQNTNKHLGPYDKSGHLGDLPVLYVDADGKAETTTLAPKLKEKDLAGHSLMIHAGGDNYSDQPKPLGGGGDRIACGAV